MKHLVTEGVDRACADRLVLILETVLDVHLFLLLIGVVDHLLHHFCLVEKNRCVRGEKQNDCDEEHAEYFPADAAAKNVLHGSLLETDCFG